MPPFSVPMNRLGDFNARVGENRRIWSGVLGRHGIGRVKANGITLLTLCSEHDITVTNTIFQQKAKYKTPWMHPLMLLTVEIGFVRWRWRGQPEESRSEPGNIKPWLPPLP